MEKQQSKTRVELSRNNPLIRFPEFKDAWGQFELGELVIKTDKKNKENLNLPVYSINNTIGFVPQDEQFEGRNSKDRGFDISIYKIVGRNTFAYNPARINVGSIGYSYELDNVLISSLYVCFKTKEILDDIFLLQFLNTNSFRVSVLRIQEGGVRQYLFFENLSKIRIFTPTIPEQKRIASFFTVLDKKIAELKQKKNLLEHYKKGIMQKLFSQEMSFKDENGKEFPKWEKKRLGEIAKFSKGKGIAKTDISEDGNFECIRYGELYTHYGEVISKIKSKTNLEEKDLVFSEANVVIIPASGESQIDIAKASCVIKAGIALGGDLNILKGNFNGVFLSYYLNNRKKNEIAILAQGVSVVHLYSSQLSTLEITLPSFSEQNKISNFITTIDDKINRTENQLQQTQQYKKGLLQKMFI